MATYKIVRFYEDTNKRERTIETGLSLEQVQEHCSSPESDSRTTTTKQAVTRRNGAWFDGFRKESN